jgi:hypothetical protein
MLGRTVLTIMLPNPELNVGHVSWCCQPHTGEPWLLHLLSFRQAILLALSFLIRERPANNLPAMRLRCGKVAMHLLRLLPENDIGWYETVVKFDPGVLAGCHGEDFDVQGKFNVPFLSALMMISDDPEVGPKTLVLEVVSKPDAGRNVGISLLETDFLGLIS